MKKRISISHLSCVVLLALYAATIAGLHAQAPAQLAVSSNVTYTAVMQGYQDPYSSFIRNLAPSGSAALNFTTYANFPYGSSPFGYTGTLTANSGATYIACPFTFNTSLVAPGVYGLTATAINNVSKATLVTDPTYVTVYAHPQPSLVLGGSIVPLNQPSSNKFTTTLVPPTPANPGAPLDYGAPDLTNASLPPQEAGTEGPAGGFAPGMIGDPPANIPSAELDLDSVTYSGDSEIVYDGPVSFEDLPATDSPSENDLPLDIFLYTDNVGVTYQNIFTLHYSDEQDIPGADAPGSEEESFTVDGTLNANGSVTWDLITTPEPQTAPLLLAAIAALISLPRFRLFLEGRAPARPRSR